ncbi:hypothetical protein EB796_008137 [Bugula neritina]|uniref:Uncharacterized protein n=1 Tax=Bugula neritina TaxID=10212 RepID=A0A7J7K5U7_BUGNE|nr:hypothetical protein EB796_008137 [Bugula neritina]
MEYIMWIKIIFISGLLASHCLFVEPAPTLRAANLRKSMDMAEKTSSHKLSRAKRFSFNLSTRIDICPFVMRSLPPPPPHLSVLWTKLALPTLDMALATPAYTLTVLDSSVFRDSSSLLLELKDTNLICGSNPIIPRGFRRYS